MRIKVLGIDDSEGTCSCCGKTNLKRVVWLEIDGAAPVAYGTSCAAKTAGIAGTWSAAKAYALKRRINAEDAAKRSPEEVAADRAREDAEREAAIRAFQQRLANLSGEARIRGSAFAEGGTTYGPHWWKASELERYARFEILERIEPQV